MGDAKSNLGKAAPDSTELLIGEKVPDARTRAPKEATPLKIQRAAVRQFAGRTLIFFTPLIVLVFAFEGLVWRVGETWPLKHVIRAQETNPRAFFSRLVLDQGTFRYKYLQILRRRPSILVLGSSRVLAFRHEMFGRQAESFYNAGGMIHSVADIQAFLDRLSAEDTPQVAILGIDFWWLNAAIKLEPNDSFVAGVDYDGTFSWQGHVDLLSGYIRDPASFARLFSHSIGRAFDPNAIGFQAAFHRQGFRLDGSKQFHLEIPTTPEGWRSRLPKPETVRNDILGGGPHFAFTSGVSMPLLEQLRAAVLRLQARGIFVIAYSPPVITDWARVASTAPHQKDYWRQFHQDVPALFQSLKIPFIDLETPEQLGLDDRYMRDAYHAHDTFDMALLARLCEDPRVSAHFPDVPDVAKRTLSSPRTNPLYLDLSVLDK